MIDLNILQPLEIVLNRKKSMNKTLFVHSFSKCNQMFKNGFKESILYLIRCGESEYRIKKGKMQKGSENKFK